MQLLTHPWLLINTAEHEKTGRLTDLYLKNWRRRQMVVLFFDL